MQVMDEDMQPTFHFLTYAIIAGGLISLCAQCMRSILRNPECVATC